MTQILIWMISTLILKIPRSTVSRQQTTNKCSQFLFSESKTDWNQCSHIHKPVDPLNESFIKNHELKSYCLNQEQVILMSQSFEWIIQKDTQTQKSLVYNSIGDS